MPTDKGYRFFVDSLSGPAPLGPAQAELVRMFFARTHGEIERMLAETSGLLSSLTDYAAVVVAPNAPEPGPGALRAARQAVTPRSCWSWPSSPTVPSRGAPLELPGEVSDAQVERASVASPRLFLVGAALDKAGPRPGPTGDPAVRRPGERRAAGPAEPEPEPRPSHVFVGGAARMAAAFEAVSTIRHGPRHPRAAVRPGRPC